MVRFISESRFSWVISAAKSLMPEKALRRASNPSRGASGRACPGDTRQSSSRVVRISRYISQHPHAKRHLCPQQDTPLTGDLSGNQHESPERLHNPRRDQQTVTLSGALAEFGVIDGGQKAPLALLANRRNTSQLGETLKQQHLRKATSGCGHPPLGRGGYPRFKRQQAIEHQERIAVRKICGRIRIKQAGHPAGRWRSRDREERR